MNEHTPKIEFLISETLEENQILAIDTQRIAEECRFDIYPNGDKILCHFDKPLLLLKEPVVKQKENDGKFEFEMIQEYGVF